MNDRTCNRCNKRLTTSQKKFCSHACANKTTMERKRNEALNTPWQLCSVPGCSKPGRSRTAALCPMHYHRLYRNGSLELKPASPKWDDVRGHSFGTLTAIERTSDGRWRCRCECGGARTAGLGELNRTGEANTCGIPGRHLVPDPSYSAAHDRVKRLHGPASTHGCVDCGRPADHWSYDHMDPEQRYAHGLSQHPVAYSAKSEHYQPRCVPCHKRYDLGRRDATPARFT